MKEIKLKELAVRNVVSCIGWAKASSLASIGFFQPLRHHNFIRNKSITTSFHYLYSKKIVNLYFINS